MKVCSSWLRSSHLSDLRLVLQVTVLRMNAFQLNILIKALLYCIYLSDVNVTRMKIIESLNML